MPVILPVQWALLLAVAAGAPVLLYRRGHLGGLRLFGYGLLVEVLGVLGDVYWHDVHGVGEAGGLSPAHLLVVLGGVVVLAGAVQGYRASEGAMAAVMGLAVLAALVHAVGAVWANSLHARGVKLAQDALQHQLNYLGMAAVFVLALAAGIGVLVSNRDRLTAAEG